MMNGDAIVAQVHQGAIPPNWLVLRARVSHFVRLAIFIAIFLILAGIGLVYLLGHPHEAWVPGAAGSPDTETLDSSTFAIWRGVDFAVVGILLVGLSAYLIYAFVQMSQAQDQFFILFPEGFVLKTSKTQTVPFAAIRTFSATNYRGTISFKLVTFDGRSIRLSLDGRFGNARQLAQRVLDARNQYVASASRQGPR